MVEKEKSKSKKQFDFKKFFKKLFINNIYYKLAAVFLGFMLWLFLGYLGSGI